MRRRIEQDVALDIQSNTLPPDQTNSVVSESQELSVERTEEIDGGKRAWLQVFGSFLVFANIWGFTFIFGIFESFYELSYLPDESPSSISWVGTVQSALLAIVGVLTGPLYDLGVYRTMLLSGSFLVLLGLFTLSLSTEYYQIFLSQGIAVGIGGGLLYVPSLALVSASFKKHRALALGVVTCGIGLGGIIYVAAFQSLLPQIGFPWTVRVLAFMALAIFAISIPTLVFNAPSSKPRHSSSSPPTPRKLFDKSAFTDYPFLTYSLASFFIFLGYLVPFFYIPSCAQLVLGTSQALSFWALAVSSTTSILGRLGAALAAQRVGVMLPWTTCGAISGILCFAWIQIESVGSFFAFCALYGFFSGALVALPPSIFPRICRNPDLLGTWMGMGWLWSGLAFLVGAPIAGALTHLGGSSHAQDKGINFLPVQIWSGLLLLMGVGTLGGLWMLLVKTRGEKIWV